MNELIVELVVTEECNLGCTYCYMNNKEIYMTEATVLNFQQHVGTIMKYYNKDSYHVSFFGGEPLLNWDLIQFAVNRFNNDSRCSSKMVISNGLLLDDEKYHWLRSNNCGLSLSFDGLWNNENRPLRGGIPSLDVYKNKKEFFLRNGITGCKVMVGPQSVGTMVENFKFFIDDFGFPCPDFSLVRDDIWTWEDVELFKINVALLADEIILRFKKGSPNIVGFFNLMLLDMVLGSKLGKRSMGCFAGCGGVGFLPNGNFYPCARFGSENKYPLLNANTGEVFSDNITELQKPSFCNPQAYKDCQGCEIRRYCNGGCNKSLIDYGKTEAKPIPEICELYKAIVKETIRIHKTLIGTSTYRNYIRNTTQSISQYLLC